jgi:hypothetical protein
MVAAGVRLCAREGVVRLPDEESLLLVGGPEVDHMGLKVDISLNEGVDLAPGDSVIVPVRSRRADSSQVQIWAGRGDQWVTQLLYGPGRRPKAVKVVNVSERIASLHHHTVVACLIERNYLPTGGRFARPKSRKYKEWEQLIFEAEPSPEFLKREEWEARQAELVAPPAVPRPVYSWPKKLLLKKRCPTADPSMSKVVEPSETPAEAYLVHTQIPPGNPSCSKILDRRTDHADEAVISPTDEILLGSESGITSAMSHDDDSQSESEVSTQDLAGLGRLSGGGETSQQASRDLECAFPTQIVSLVESPMSRLQETFARCLRVEVEDTDGEATVYLHEGSELLSDLLNQLAALPELGDISPSADLTTAAVGVPGETSPEMNAQVQRILEKHHEILLGDGNAVPAPARGVVCELDVGDSKPVAQRSRPIRPQHLQKVYDLLKKLLETKLIEYSESDWASPIVIVMKKNGIDIRLCIDYRLVNQLIKLMHYPLPLIDDLLIGFEHAMWFLSLDMASGFWAVPMTLRAKMISAFICPLGHFQWTRMPFGLKNAPLIYQQMLDNCLWGFVRFPASEEAQVDADVGIEAEAAAQDEEIPALTEGMTGFRRNIPAPPQLNPVLGRSSYIDDIAYGTETWEQLCIDLDRLLYRLRYWGISVSLPKSEFGKRSILQRGYVPHIS